MNFNRLAFAVLFLAGISNAFAQGTAFIYQGKLANNGVSANGSYDLAFTLYSTNTAGAVIAGPVTNSATAVSNGLFSTTIDFGAGVFNGSNYWLDISVSPAGSNTFVDLSPRQAIMPTPYAIYSANAAMATSAASVSASNISGTVSAAQLPGTVLTNGAGSVNLAGSFSGNGSGLTGINGAISWQAVCGTHVQAASNTGYLLTNNSLVTVTLPPSPNLGDIVRISCPGQSGWKVVENAGQTILNNFGFNFTWTNVTVPSIYAAASSADGTKLVALAFVNSASGILTSTNSGMTWTVQSGAPSALLSSVASSVDGTRLVAISADYNNYGNIVSGGIYTSTNSGVTWVDETNAPNMGWTGIASSADGTKLVAGGYDEDGMGAIYTSTDSGVTWVEQANTVDEVYYWSSIVSSADGTKSAAIGNGEYGGGEVYTSTDSGVTWVEQPNSPNTYDLASSVDMTKLATAFDSQVYTSTDSGVTWVGQTVQFESISGGALDCIASSADGTRLAIGGFGTQILTSSDSGQTWTAQGTRFGAWSFICSSADGTSLLAMISNAQGGGGIVTVPTNNLTGEPNTAVELQYIGNGQFLPISYTTGISAH